MKGTAVKIFDSNWSLSVFCIVHERAYVVSHMDDGHAGFGVLRETTARVTRYTAVQEGSTKLVLFLRKDRQ